MSRFDESQTELLIQRIAASTPEAGKALSRCFDRQFQIDFVDSSPYEMEDFTPNPDWTGPGLVVSIDIDDESLIVLIPEHLPLPPWYRTPNVNQHARLQTLAMEWSIQLLPRNLEPTSYSTVAVDNLHAAVVSRRPTSTTAELLMSCRELEGNFSPVPLHALFPVAYQRVDLATFPTEATESSHEASADFAPPKTKPPASNLSSGFGGAMDGVEKVSDIQRYSQGRPTWSESGEPLSDRLKMIRSLPVTLSVRLAEKKVELSSLLNISPGTLLTFNKSCEDYLDLYVNNQRYGRGEAIKIGEKFGLRINEIESFPF